MPYNTRSRPLHSESPQPAKSPFKRGHNPAEAAPPGTVHPRLRDVVCQEDAANDVLMAACTVLAEIKDSRSLCTHDMAKLTPYSAQAISTCIRGHLRREHPPHLLLRHEPTVEIKIPTYSLNVPLSPGADGVEMVNTLPQSLSHAPSEHSDEENPFEIISEQPSTEMFGEWREASEVPFDDDETIQMDEDEAPLMDSDPHPTSHSPVSSISPPPPLTSSTPRMRNVFPLTFPSRAFSPDETSDGSSPPTTPRSERSPLSPMVSSKLPTSPSVLLNPGLSSMLISSPRTIFDQEMPQSYSIAIDQYDVARTDISPAPLLPPFPLLGPPSMSPSPQQAPTDFGSTIKMLPPGMLPSMEPQLAQPWDADDDDDWMLGPETMPLEEVDRECSACWWSDQ